MERLFLLDAYALIYRAYYAMIKTPRINSKGLNTSAILGFVNTLQEILTKENPTHIGIAFDPKGGTFRHKLFEQYKAQREETPEVIRLSVPIIKDIISAYNIPILEVEGFEADDVIGTLAKQANENGIVTYMLTPDKDYCQLVTDTSLLYRPRFGDKGYDVLGPKEVLEKYGIVNTSQIIDLLGLMGDSADNIPGCPGVGPKTAQKLISDFGSIENLIENTDKLKGSLKEKIESNAEQIRFSKMLATIRTDVPISLNMESLKKERPDMTRLASILGGLEMHGLLGRITKEERNFPDIFADNGTADAENPILRGFDSSYLQVQVIDNKKDVCDLARQLSDTENISFQMDTTDDAAVDAKIIGIAICTETTRAWYIDIPEAGIERDTILQAAATLFSNDRIGKTCHNLKPLILAMANSGIELKGELFDTMVAHYVIQPEQRHTLEHLSETYLHESVDIEENEQTASSGMLFFKPDIERLSRTSCIKALLALRLRPILEDELEKDNTTAFFREVEMPLVSTLADMERCGVSLDTDALKESSGLFTERLHRIEDEVYTLAGLNFNILSPKQVGDVLFDRLKVTDKAKKTKSGQYVTSEEVLESLRDKSPIVGKILEYRGLKKLIGTYVDALPQLINPRTGKIHTSFNQTVTATGRLSSSGPNLQNIPIRDEDGKEVRKAFIPDPGCKFFSADYSQIELRIMAHLSHDRNMIEDFEKGEDIHAATAAKIFHKPISEVTKTERAKAKTANFGIIYGISAFGLAERMKVSRTEAKELIDNYFLTYPDIRTYITGQIEEARQKGYVETIMHRKRYLPDITSHNATVRGYAERNAVNAPIQGSAADIIKYAMVNISREFKKAGLKSSMILQVHDELNFNVIPGEEDMVRNIVTQQMQEAYRMSVKLIADCGWGDNWLEAH